MKQIFQTFILSLLIATVFSGCGVLSYMKDPFTPIDSFRKVDEYVYRGGKLDESDFDILKENSIRTIISLRGNDDLTATEKTIAENKGIRFINIPLSVLREPNPEEVELFLESVLKKENQPVYVHCTSGRDRTGAMIALYRVVVYGWGPKEAYEEAKSLGFWPYKGDEALKTFIHQLKDHPEYYKQAELLLNEK